MGHRKSRKRDRRLQQRFAPSGAPPALDDRGFDEPGDLFSRVLALAGDDASDNGRSPGYAARSAAPVCGSCREFVEDQEGGRGTCLHPGSGFAFPWTDTPGCPFFANRGRR